ncbi:MAG: hypothetical protein HOP09_00730 [Hyphomicrobium sp.]|nr:hypothetical protein [Hyphomicrobium sp.]
MAREPHIPAKSQQPAGLSGREAVAAAFALGAEAVVVLLAFSADVPLAWTIGFHLATVLAVGLILFQDRDLGADLTVAALMFLVIAVAGPAGAFASLAALAFVDHAGAGPEVLQAWYDRLAHARHADASTELTDRVVAGRVLRTQAQAPESFEDVIAHGTLVERQAALGLMARRFHTDFAPALQAALRSEEPVVRVQAAAVVARVRGDLKARIKALTSVRDRRASAHRIADAAELMRLAGCTLVDRADADKCRKAATETLQVALVTSHEVRTAAGDANRETAPVIERFLVTAGRHADFRVSRRIHNLVVDSRYRLRRVNGSMAA